MALEQPAQPENLDYALPVAGTRKPVGDIHGRLDARQVIVCRFLSGENRVPAFGLLTLGAGQRPLQRGFTAQREFCSMSMRR